jgi:hypothetical protein
MRNRNGMSPLGAPDRSLGLVQEHIVIDMKVSQIGTSHHYSAVRISTDIETRRSAALDQVKIASGNSGPYPLTRHQDYLHTGLGVASLRQFFCAVLL